MLRILLILMLFLNNYVYSQKPDSGISLTILSYKDTTKKDERDYMVKLRLTNNGKKSIIISNQYIPRIYMKYVYTNCLRSDTISTKKLLEHLDIQVITPFVYKELKPNESKEVVENLFGFLGKTGDVSVKMYFRLSDLNENIADAESDWFSTHVSYTHEEVLNSE